MSTSKRTDIQNGLLNGLLDISFPKSPLDLRGYDRIEYEVSLPRCKRKVTRLRFVYGLSVYEESDRPP